jgi:hypothetical protein
VTATADASLGLGEWPELARLSPAAAAEATVMPDLVRFGPDNEPVVRLIKEMPQAKYPGHDGRAPPETAARPQRPGQLVRRQPALATCHQSLPLRASVRNTDAVLYHGVPRVGHID